MRCENRLGTIVAGLCDRLTNHLEHVFVDEIRDGDGWNDFQHVWYHTAVEARDALAMPNVFEHLCRGQQRMSFTLVHAGQGNDLALSTRSNESDGIGD